MCWSLSRLSRLERIKIEPVRSNCREQGYVAVCTVGLHCTYFTLTELNTLKGVPDRAQCSHLLFCQEHLYLFFYSLVRSEL